MPTKEATPTKPRHGVSIRIEDDTLDLLMDEQFRLRKEEGKKYTYSEIVRRWAQAANSAVNKKKPKSNA